MRSPADLHDYQRFAIDHILEHPAAGLFLDMGLGKTVSTLTAIEELMFNRFETSRVLVVAPKRAAAHTWPTEVKEWTHTTRLRISPVVGTAKQREKALQARADIYVINRENLDWLVKKRGPARFDFDMVVLDELSSFKNNQSKRFKALRTVRRRIRRVVGLTGTPTPNGLLDLWPQLYLLDMGARLGPTIGGYRAQYFQPAQMFGMIVTKYRLRPGAEQQIHQKIGDICIAMKAEDYLELPGRIDLIHPVILGTELTDRYARFEENTVMTLGGKEITGANAAAMTAKLLQFCSGAIYDEHHNWQHLHDAKMEALDELVEANLDKPLLVFYQFQHELERILKRYPDAEELGGPEHINKWNRGEVKMLVCHPASAGHGLNLQHGGNTIIWYSLPWSLELYQQAIDRLDRQGQDQIVMNYILTTSGTVEDGVARSLADKAMTQEKLMEAIKAKLKDTQRKIKQVA